ncbi:hypothetical protein N9937_00935 [bacterium]|nr:hypothetical protein [bacterium]
MLATWLLILTLNNGYGSAVTTQEIQTTKEGCEKIATMWKRDVYSRESLCVEKGSNGYVFEEE